MTRPEMPMTACRGGPACNCVVECPGRSTHHVDRRDPVAQGNVASAHGGPRLIGDALATAKKAGATGMLTVRADSAHYNHAVSGWAASLCLGAVTPHGEGLLPVGLGSNSREADSVDDPERWAFGPNHPVVNRFIGSLSKLGASEWVTVLRSYHSPTSDHMTPIAKAAATEAGRGTPWVNAERFTKECVAYNYWAGPRWQDQAVAILANSGADINAVEVEYLAGVAATEAAGALVSLDLIPAKEVEQAISPFRATSARVAEIDQLAREITLMKLAFRGDTDAMMSLAETADEREDTAGQIVWLSMAAKAGLEDSFKKLGRKYLDVGKDDEAHNWLSRAARCGDVDAMLILSGESDRWGDHEQADRWLRAAAEAGSPQAMNAMGRRVYNDGKRLGLSVDERIEEAARWYTQAAEAGDTYAMNTLAHWAESDGDLEGAARWRDRAEKAAGS